MGAKQVLVRREGIVEVRVPTIASGTADQSHSPYRKFLSTRVSSSPLAALYRTAGMFSYFWKFYTNYLRDVAQSQMAKIKSRTITPNGTSEKTAKRPRIAWMDESDDESHNSRINGAEALKSLKFDAQSPRPSKKQKVAAAGPSSSKHAVIQEQRKQLPIAQGVHAVSCATFILLILVTAQAETRLSKKFGTTT